MTFVRTVFSIAAVTAATLYTSAWANNDKQQDSHHPAANGGVQMAQATSDNPAMGMGGMEQRMEMMQSMMQMMVDRMQSVPATK